MAETGAVQGQIRGAMIRVIKKRKRQYFRLLWKLEAPMTPDKSKALEALMALSPDYTEPLGLLPGQVEIRAPKGCLPPERAAMKHAWHSRDSIQVPTSLMCGCCPLYHIKRRDKRHPLACPAGKKNQVCRILARLQQNWAVGLIREIEESVGSPPTPSDNARIEQIIRHRSRIFQAENYLKVAGMIDLKRGEIRNVADRLVTTENALSRVLTEFRQALADRRDHRAAAGPRLEDYLKEVRAVEADADDEDAKESS